jgi:hypothetical protein
VEKRGKTGRDRGGGVGVRAGAGVRVTVGDALPAGKKPPKYKQNREDP